MQRSKQKSFDKHKKQVAFKAPPNQINKKIFARPLTQLLVHVFKGVDADSDYPYKNTHDFLGILFDRKFNSPSMQFLMYQEQRAKQKNAEHLNNLVRKGLLSMDKRLKVELKEECLSIALTLENCFNVELPMKIGNAPTANIESVMAAKIQCYHIWLFYYLYSADFKFIKAIFKLKFEFVKILFARDFSVLFFTNENHSAKVKKRKNSSLQLLEELYFPDDLKQGTNGSYQSQQGKYSQKDRNRKKIDYLMKFKNYVQNPTAPTKVPLLAYNVPVTDRQVRDKEREMVNGNRRMRIDWKTIDKVVEWVRSRIYEVCLPTERTLSLFKFNIDDPVRSFVSSKRTQYKAISQRESEQATFSIKEIKADLGQIERAHLTEHLWDQRFQGNRFVILDQELIHNYQDKLIDLNQGKKEFSLEKHEYKASSLAWCNDFYRMFKSERNRFKGGELNVKSKEFKLPSNYNVGEFQVLTAQNSSFVRSYPNLQAVNQSMNTTMMSGISGQQPFYGEQGASFRTREFYFLKQGIFEHRLFSKYIVKCRKERHFLDFGKKKRDDELVDEQSSDQLGYMSTSMISDQSRRMMPHGMRAKSFNQQSLKSQRQFILQQEQAKKRTNTEFDILDQMLTLAPISYNQYQVLQTTCYHMLNFNELLMTEQFINTIFGDLKCCLKPLSADNLLSMEPAEASKDILHTYEQLMERSEHDVMGVLVKDQLLNKIDIVKEALTSPGACREYDYERLEFYGDSIIGFLVILELFVTQPAMVEGDLDFKRIQKVSNMKFYEVNKENKFHDYMITESHQVYSGYDHAGLDPSDCKCQTIRQGKPCCTCKRNSSKITQKHQNELQNKLSQLKLIRKRLCELDADDDYPDPLEQIFMRGNIYQLAEMINKDPALAKDYASSEMSSSLQQSALNQSNKSIAQQKWPMTETEKIQKICVNILDEIGGPRECLKKNINKVIMKVESQISQNYKKSGVKNYRQKGPFYYKQLADVVESVSGAVTLACGLNCTQDYLRKIGVLEFDQAYLMREMTKLLDKQKEKSLQLDNEFYHGKKMNEVEKILGYEFSCKAWLIEALTHKSFSREHEKQNACLEDYERLEFLGDSVLGCLMARHFFLSTQKDGVRKNPKELHKMKTSVINNNLLSLIVIENKIHEYMIYNTKAPSFKEQFEKYVSTVHEMTKKCGTTKDLVEYKKRLIEQQPSSNQDSVKEPEQVLKEFDLDLLHEHNLKIFGDVFESLIGAVFLDSQSVEKTWEILFRLMSPYVQIYANLETLQDHSRTLLLEMWNQKPYTKNLTCKHKTEELENGERSCLKGIIVGRDRQEHVVFAESFNKDAKSKIRTFYKHFYQLVKKFVDKVDLLAEDKQREYYMRPGKVIEKIKRLWEKEKEAERKLREMEEDAVNQTATAFTPESIEEEKKSEVVDNNVIVEEAASEEQEEEEVKYDPVPPRRDSFDVKFKVSNNYDQEMTKR